MAKVLNIIFIVVVVISLISIGVMYFWGQLTYGKMLIIAVILLFLKLFILAYEHKEMNIKKSHRRNL